MGSITDITDCHGTVLNHYAYDAFGNRTVEEETVENRFGFAGEILDAVTGQYYLRARFYNPVIARFLSEDTYYGDGLNLYAYCHNNPVGYVDPSGHYRLICDKKYGELKQKEADGGKLSIKEQLQIYRYEKHQKKQQGNKTRPETQRKKWKEYTGVDPTGEIHHGLPEEFSQWFSQRGIDVNSGEYYYDLPKDKHRKKEGNGIHTNNSGLTDSAGNPSNWNAVWREYIEKHPNASRQKILAKLKEMEKATNIGQYRAKKGQ